MIATVIGPFAEAVRATAQPCTFLLIVPTMTAVVACRARWQALVAAVLAGILGGWVLIDNRWILDGWLLRVSATLVIALLVVVASQRLRSSIPRVAGGLEHDVSLAGIVAVITFAATLWWRPCVGEELGRILNGAQHGTVGQLIPMTAYMLGALVPVAAVVAVRYAVQPSERMLEPIVWVSAALGVVISASLVAGRHDDVVVALTRWTLE